MLTRWITKKGGEYSQKIKMQSVPSANVNHTECNDGLDFKKQLSLGRVHGEEREALRVSQDTVLQVMEN